MLNNSFIVTFEQAIDDEGRAQALNFGTEDTAEALAAFTEKRDPVFRGGGDDQAGAGGTWRAQRVAAARRASPRSRGLAGPPRLRPRPTRRRPPMRRPAPSTTISVTTTTACVEPQPQFPSSVPCGPGTAIE